MIQKAATKQQNLTALRLQYPDTQVKTFQVPANSTCKEIIEYLVDEKLEFGNQCYPQEFLFFDSVEGALGVIDQEQPPPTLPSGHNLMLRRYFYLKDARKVNPSAQLSAFDLFQILQTTYDYLKNRTIYPVKYIVELSTLILIDKYGKFDAKEHRSVCTKPLDFLPKWVTDIKKWSKNYQLGKGISKVQGCEGLSASNMEQIFAKQLEQTWIDFSKQYLPEEVQLKARQRFLEVAYGPELELYSQIQCFKVSAGSQMINESLTDNFLFGVGPLGIHFFDSTELTIKWGYHFQQILTYDPNDKVVTLAMDDQQEYKLTFDNQFEAYEVFSLIDGYIVNQSRLQLQEDK